MLLMNSLLISVQPRCYPDPPKAQTEENTNVFLSQTNWMNPCETIANLSGIFAAIIHLNCMGSLTYITLQNHRGLGGEISSHLADEKADVVICKTDLAKVSEPV